MQNSFSKGEYKRLSERLRKITLSPEIAPEDYDMLQSLRITYKEPLSDIFNIVNRLSHRQDSNSVCTYRIKRIESIVGKLQRYPTMEVHRMADIAGCRCIMTTESDAIKLYQRFLKYAAKKSSKIEVKRVNNYIEAPKDSGYRSIHLNVCLSSHPDKVIEIQIRSLEQHNWATLVEISDVVYKAQLKEHENKNNSSLYEFHQLLSRSDDGLTLLDKRKIANLSGNFKYLETLGKKFSSNILELRKQRNSLRATRAGSYYLISTDKDGSPEIQQFRDFNDAETRYFEMFIDNLGNKNIVLTHFVDVSFDKISMAYSNYVMTYNATLFKVLKAIGEVATVDYNNYSLINFAKNYRAFWEIISIWFKDRADEIQTFSSAKLIKSSKKNKEWSISLGSNFLIVWAIIQEVQKQLKGGLLYLPASACKKRIDKRFSYIQRVFGEVFSLNFKASNRD